MEVMRLMKRAITADANRNSGAFRVGTTGVYSLFSSRYPLNDLSIPLSKRGRVNFFKNPIR
jgi:hypothetical protein